MEDKLIDIEELWKLLKRSFWIIILVTTITTSLGFYKVARLEPTYIAQTKIFIGRGSQLVQYFSEQEVEYYSKFISIFNEVVRIDGYLDEVLKKNNINKSSIQVASGLNFIASENTPIYTVTYSSWDDKDMEKTLDAVVSDLLGKVKEMMPETNPIVLDTARVSIIYPNKTKLPVLAFFVGILTSIGLIIAIDYLDNRIRTKKQLEKLLPIAVLGEIPTEEKKFERRKKGVYNKSNAKVGISRSL